MSGFHRHSCVRIASLFTLAFAVPTFGQLSLMNSRENRYEHKTRAQRFMANRSIEATLRDRIQSRSILLGQLPWVTNRSNQQPLLFSREFGVAGNMQGPRDRAGRSLQSLQVYNDYSQFAKGIVNIPRPSDYLVDTNSIWTVENVLESMKAEESTALLLPPASPKKSARESSIDAQTNAYFEEGATAFRAALSETNGSDRATFFANARHSFDLVNQLDVDGARGHLALAVVRFVQEDVNSAETHLVLGLQRSQTLEQMDIGLKNFFPDIELWQRRLDQLNIATRSSNNPRLLLLYAYWAFLNGDDVIALNSVEEAERLYEAIFKQSRGNETTEVKGEEELNSAKRFADLLRTKIDTAAGGPTDDTPAQQSESRG